MNIFVDTNRTQTMDRKKTLDIMIHVIAWGIVLGLPFFFTGRDEAVTLDNYLRFIIPPTSFIIVFYINYFILIDRFLSKKQQGLFILANIILIAAALVGVHSLLQLFPKPINAINHPPHNWKDMVRFFTMNIFLYALVAGLSVAIKMTGRWYLIESERKELEKSRTEAELQNLKSQLNPHFLFNTLNNIYSLIAFSPERAQGAVHELSRLLRYVLYDSSQQFVPLSKEIDFIKNYVDLMRIRLPEHVEVDTDISIKNQDALIAPLLFISLIENAFKHGVSNSEPSFINIKINQDKDSVFCLIENSFFPKGEKDQSGSGIGIVNLQKRLELIYPDAHSLTCTHQDKKYISNLTIKIREQ